MTLGRVKLKKPRRGQALIEFIFMMPLLILALFIAVKSTEILLQGIRTHSAQWFALRADTFDAKHQEFSSTSTVESQIKSDMFGSRAKDITVKISNSHSASVADAVGAFAPYMFPLMKETTLTVTYSLPSTPADSLTQNSGWSGTTGKAKVTRKMVVDAVVE